MEVQVIATVLASLFSTLFQESVFGQKVTGRAAAWLSVAITFVAATIAAWATGGFATATAGPAFNLLDPSVFFSFWWHLWAPVYALTQTIYSVTTSHQVTGDAAGPIQAVASRVQPIIGTDKPAQ